jgi:hypothetical protein
VKVNVTRCSLHLKVLAHVVRLICKVYEAGMLAYVSLVHFFSQFLKGLSYSILELDEQRTVIG